MTTTIRKTYSAGSISIAVRTIVNGTQNTLNWLLSDHLGSASITTTADGTWFSELRYSAFGETRYSSGITGTDYRYTGQLEQADINLYYYNARYYDPALGRFVQSDTIIPQPNSILSYDRFAYVGNNPLRYTDPSGHKIALDEFNNGMTVRTNSKNEKIIVDRGPGIANYVEQAMANYMLSGNTNYLKYGVPKGADSFSYGASMESAAEGIGKDAGNRNRTAIMAIASIAMASNYGAYVGYVTPNTQLNIYGRTETIYNNQTLWDSAAPISKLQSTGLEAAEELRGLSSPSQRRTNRVWENSLTVDDAKTWFTRIADPDSVRTNNRVEGGMLGDVCGVEGGVVGFRPVSSKYPYPPTIDLFDLPGFPNKTEIKFLGN